ncbi:MAG: type III pantothenate kinase [Planctomycetes bacterium]|nr:type III pantothenate kinase [Planctomycetota bacterium]
MGGARELLTVDLGNSACKARRWRIAQSVERIDAREWPTRAGVGDELARWLATCALDARAGLAAVAARELEAEVQRALGARLVAPLDAGLVNEYRTPHTLGADRLFAARGAVERLRRSCLVVDAGTTVTVDAVRVDADGTRHFLGGAIAPGPALLAQALHVGTARLPLVVASADAPALGRDTDSAVTAGVVHGFRGLVRGLVDAVGRDANLADAPIALGGGARALLGESALPGRRVEALDDLVHLGLVAALLDALGGAA